MTKATGAANHHRTTSHTPSSFITTLCRRRLPGECPKDTNLLAINFSFVTAINHHRRAVLASPGQLYDTHRGKPSHRVSPEMAVQSINYAVFYSEIARFVVAASRREQCGELFHPVAATGWLLYPNNWTDGDDNLSIKR